MTIADLLGLIGAVGALAGVAWYFFAPRSSVRAELHDGVQEATCVKGGYSPDVIRVRAGIPLRLRFDRQESGDCTARVIFADFALARSLPATPPPSLS